MCNPIRHTDLACPEFISEQQSRQCHPKSNTGLQKRYENPDENIVGAVPRDRPKVISFDKLYCLTEDKTSVLPTVK
jgi:hypothetical protein